MTSGRVSGAPSRGSDAPTRTTWTREGLGAIAAVLALGLVFRFIIAQLNPGSGFGVDLISFRAWAGDLASQGLGGFYERASRGSIREDSRNSRHSRPQVFTVSRGRAVRRARSLPSSRHQILKSVLRECANPAPGASPIGSPVHNPFAVARLCPCPGKLQSGFLCSLRSRG